MPEVTAFQHGAFTIDDARPGAPQHQPANGVGEARAGNGLPALFQLGRNFIVGGEQYVEGGAVDDLRVELAGGAGDDDCPVAGVFFKISGYAFNRGGKIGCDSDLRLVGASARRG